MASRKTAAKNYELHHIEADADGVTGEQFVDERNRPIWYVTISYSVGSTPHGPVRHKVHGRNEKEIHDEIVGLVNGLRASAEVTRSARVTIDPSKIGK